MDELDEFLMWFLSQGPVLGRSPVMSSVTSFGQDEQGGQVISNVWYRKDQFQVELFTVVGPCIIPEHTHPNVNSYEVLIGGQIRFSHLGKWMMSDTYQQDTTEDGLSPYRGQKVRVNHNDPHGAVVGPGGGMFFSVQHWLNGVKPSSVGFDWDGRTSSEEHLTKVKFGNPSFIKKTEKMAVSQN